MKINLLIIFRHGDDELENDQESENGQQYSTTQQQQPQQYTPEELAELENMFASEPNPGEQQSQEDWENMWFADDATRELDPEEQQRLNEEQQRREQMQLERQQNTPRAPIRTVNNQRTLNDIKEKATRRKILRAVGTAGKFAAKSAAVLGGAAVGGMAGLMIGSLKGDPSEAVTTAIQGAAVLGGGTKFVTSHASPWVKDKIESIRYKHNPTGYLEKQQEKQEKRNYDEYMKNTTNHRRAAAIAKSLGRNNSDVKEIQEQMYQMSQYGITSMKDQARAIEMTSSNGGNGRDLLDNAWAVQKAKSVDYTDEKKRDGAIEGFMAEAEKAGYKNRNQQIEYALQKVDLVRSVNEKGYLNSAVQSQDHARVKNKYGTNRRQTTTTSNQSNQSNQSTQSTQGTSTSNNHTSTTTRTNPTPNNIENNNGRTRKQQ